MIIILGAILIFLLGFLGLLIYDLKRVTRELHYINMHETNALITTSTNLLFLNQLVKESNDSLKHSRDIKLAEVQKDKQIRQMLTNLTHDIKTPLTVSMGYVQLMRKDSSVDVQESLEKVSKNLSSVNYYLHYLMDFNTLQEKGINLKITEVDVAKLLEAELFSFYDEFERRNLQVIPKIAAGTIIKTDEVILQRIFQNLIGNTLKYAKDKVEVQLFLKNENYVEIIFKNMMIGELKHPERLLNRFYTGDESRTNQSSGIGLSIVQSLVTLLGGKFTLEVTTTTFMAIISLKKSNYS